LEGLAVRVTDCPGQILPEDISTIGTGGNGAPIGTDIVTPDKVAETLLGHGNDINGSNIEAVMDLAPFEVHSTNTVEVLVLPDLKTPPVIDHVAVKVL
jgi:hypothetical protein